MVPIDQLFQVGKINKITRFTRIGKINKLIKLSRIVKIIKIIRVNSRLVRQLSEILRIGSGTERLLYVGIIFIIL